MRAGTSGHARIGHVTDPTSAPAPEDQPPELSGPPRWVKVAGAIALALLLLFAALMLTGGPSEHGPGRHGFGSPDSGQVRPTSSHL